MFKIILTQTDCSPKQLCTTEMQHVHVQGINFMPQKIPNPHLPAAPPGRTSHDENNNISRCPICFSQVGGIKEQLNRLAA